MTQEVYTITYGDQAENHVGMQKIGQLSTEGFNINDLKNASKLFTKKGAKCELINLSSSKEQELDEAYILIIRNGVDTILKSLKKTKEDLLEEQQNIKYDDKAFMYGRVVNKKARHNVCFSNNSQEPDYQNGKGRIISFKNARLTNYIRNKLPIFLGNKAKNLKAEGNHYYDITKTGIGFHGDSERMKVVGVRIGNTSLPLYYQWFYKNKPIGDKIIIELDVGDVYIMSQKATGNDWKKKNIKTLRHATGSAHYTQLKTTLTPKQFHKTLVNELQKYDKSTIIKLKGFVDQLIEAGNDVQKKTDIFSEIGQLVMKFKFESTS